jgi:hypothetical protein
MQCQMKNDRTLMGLCCVTPHSTIFQVYRGVLLVAKIGIPGEIHRPATSHWQTLSHNVVSSTPCMNIGSCKSNYHTITTIKLLNQRFLVFKFKSSPRKFYNRHRDFFNRDGIYVSQIITDMFRVS